MVAIGYVIYRALDEKAFGEQREVMSFSIIVDDIITIPGIRKWLMRTVIIGLALGHRFLCPGYRPTAAQRRSEDSNVVAELFGMRMILMIFSYQVFAEYEVFRVQYLGTRGSRRAYDSVQRVSDRRDRPCRNQLHSHEVRVRRPRRWAYGKTQMMVTIPASRRLPRHVLPALNFRRRWSWR